MRSSKPETVVKMKPGQIGGNAPALSMAGAAIASLANRRRPKPPRRR